MNRILRRRACALSTDIAFEWRFRRGSIGVMHSIRRWAWCSVLAPLLLCIVVFAIMAVLNEHANPSSALDVAANWMLVMIFGTMFYLPAIPVTVLGVLAVTELPRLGRVVATAGLLWMSAVWSFAIAGVGRPTFDPQPYDDVSWAATLTVPELLVFAVPYVGMLVLNVVTLWMLWRPSSWRCETFGHGVAADAEVRSTSGDHTL